MQVGQMGETRLNENVTGAVPFPKKPMNPLPTLLPNNRRIANDDIWNENSMLFWLVLMLYSGCVGLKAMSYPPGDVVMLVTDATQKQKKGALLGEQWITKRSTFKNQLRGFA